MQKKNVKANKKPTYQDLERKINELKSENKQKQNENRSNKQLRASEERFRLLMLNMEVGIIVYAPDTSIILNNIKASEILGLSEEQIRKKKAIHPDWKFVKPDKSPLPFEEYPVNKIANSKKSLKNIILGVSQSDKIDIVWVTVNGYPRLNNTGDVTEIVISFIDISKQMQIKEDKLLAITELKNTERRLIEAQKVSQIGSWLFDLPDQKLECSEETFHIWGFNSKKSAPNFDTLVNRIHPDDQELFTNAVDKAINLGIPFDIEHRIYPHNEEQRILRNICKPELGVTGQIIRLSGTSQNITKQKQAEQEKLSTIVKLENSEKRLNQTQGLAQIGSWFIDLQNQKVEWSDEAFKIWGLDSKKGPPTYDFLLQRIHTDDLELFSTSYNEAVQKGTPYDIEFQIYLPNGEEKTLRNFCQSVKGAKGEVISLLGANQDVTSKKIFEKTQMELQRLKAIGEMSSSIAHDFNNSLQQIMGNLEVIKLQNDYPENTLERLNNIGSIIADVAGRVSALQQFGDTEHDTKNTKLIDFNTLIKESLMQSRPLWKDDTEKKGLKINIITDFKDIPKIIGHNGELKSAVYNLIKNSIEAMPEGGDIVIKTKTKGKRIFATFTDTGMGMNEETKVKVFEPFFTTKGFELGRGLGMSGVFNIIKKSNGNIVVKSSVLSEGSTFEIDFPIAQQDKSKAINKNKTKNKAAYNILWVDDDVSITEDAHELLELMGHNCTIANNGKSALEYLNKNTCDIVFTDIGMSGMNGWELIAAIRKKIGRKIKIITVSGWNIDEKTKKEHAIDFVLQKPFSKDKLEKLLLAL